MKEKITFPTLVATLALASGKSKKQCEDFLREFLDIIEQSLQNGEQVKIKNLGTFKVVTVESRKSIDVNTGESIEIPAHNKISFIPAKELADDVNKPFSMFESVEVEMEENNSHDVEEEVVEKGEDVKLPEGETENSAAVTVAGEISDKSNDDNDSAGQYNLDDLEEQEAVSREETEIEQPNVTEYSESVDSIQNTVDVKPRKSLKFLWGFLTGLTASLIILFIGIQFLDDSLIKIINNSKIGIIGYCTGSEASKTDDPEDTEIDMNSNKESLDTDNNEMASESVPTVASDTQVTDTISRIRFLTTMAKEHYGNFNLWPYIYIENQNKLGHPDRIKPGTIVVIPPLSKYNVDPTDEKTIEEAKLKGLEIYRKFQN